jgi:hypothetical protein
MPFSQFLIMCFDPFAHRPIMALVGCLIIAMCLVLGLSSLPLWHVQRSVETSNNLNRKCFIKFPKGENNSTFHNNALGEHFFKCWEQIKTIKLHIICILLIFND